MLKKKSKKQQALEKQLAKLVKKHDKIENPICYTGRCPVCNKMDEIQAKLKLLKGKKILKKKK